MLDDNLIDLLLPEDFYPAISSGRIKRDFYPPFSDEAAWLKANETLYAAVIIENAEEAINTPVPPLRYSNYHRFTRDGNRVSYQTPYFLRRKNLACIALALCLTRDKEKYMPHLLDYTVAIMEEWTWCLPAHMQWQNEGKSPGTFYQTDLFCAETGAVMAALCQILGDELEKEWIGITAWIHREILTRTVYNVFCNKDPDAIHKWVITDFPHNWTIWCSTNVLYSALICEKDPAKLEYFTRKLIRLGSRFTSLYHDDGFCPEGPNYYQHAAMELFRMLDLLEKIHPGSAQKAYQTPKIRNMFEFIAKLRIGKDNMLSFADSTPGMVSNFSMIMPAAAAIGSDMLLRMGAGKISDLGKNGNHLLASLALLFDCPENSAEDQDVREAFTCFPDRIAIFRSPQFEAAIKGGSNGEPHNHLDLGHISVYFDGDPVIVDAGTGVYAKQHFSAERYSIWYLAASGHNAPVFGEYGQIPGGMYTAPLKVIPPDTVKCDLSAAYPADAGVKKFIRTLNFTPEEVVIADDIDLSGPLPVNVTLLAVEKPQRISDNQLKIGKVMLTLEGILLKEISEMPEIEQLEAPLWGKALTAIRLTGGSSCKMVFRKAE